MWHQTSSRSRSPCHLPVEGVDVLVERDLPVAPLDEVQARLLHLEDLGSGVRDGVILLVERAREGHDRLQRRFIVGVHRDLVDHLAAARADLDRTIGQALGGPEHGVVLKGAAAHLPENACRQARFHDLVEDVPGHVHACHRGLVRVRRFAACRWSRGPLRASGAHADVAEAVHALEEVPEPGPAPDVGVEAHVAVGHDVEPGANLVVDERRHRVEVLLAIAVVAPDRLEERTAAQVLDEPAGARQRAGYRGREGAISGDGVHEAVLQPADGRFLVSALWRVVAAVRAHPCRSSPQRPARGFVCPCIALRPPTGTRRR